MFIPTIFVNISITQEHEKTPDTDEALSAFFRFSEDRAGKKSIKARALLIDMECGPLQETMRSPLGGQSLTC